MLDIKKIEAAINQIAAERKIPKEKLIDIIEAAIKTAYKKDYGNKDEEVNVKLDLEGKGIEITVEKTVVKEVKDPSKEISFEELGEDSEDFEEGDIIEIDMTEEVMKVDGGEAFGRIASQAARQVIIQKIGDTEKEKLYELFKGREGEIINMKVEMIEMGKVILEYNGNQIILPKSEQVPRDRYTAGQRINVYVSEVTESVGGTGGRVILSRKDKNIVPALFAMYVPEIEDGTIEIDAVVRLPGSKTKLLVSSNYDEVDPIGTLIGKKGMRIKSVMNELNGEKIDIIPNEGDIEETIKRALAPAEIKKVEIDEKERIARIYLDSEEKAKAIGKGGININLACKLLNYNIIIEENRKTEEKE